MRTLASPAPATAGPSPVRSVVSPLLPVLLALALAAVGLSLLFARWFPARSDPGAVAVTFTDVTAESGLRFVHQSGTGPAPSTLGAAVAVLDFDQDGAPDLFFVNGAPWPGEESLDKRTTRTHALFRNDGRGRFTDVTAAAGLNVPFQGMGAAAGDYDGDGRIDLFVTGVGTSRLFRNLGGGRFEDVTESAGVGGDENCWSTAAAWLDFDRDGRLDLIVLHYARWPREVGLAPALTIARLGRSYGAPAGFTSTFPTVYRNLGGGRFAPVPDAAGLRDIDPETGRPAAFPLALTLLDANEDGRLDVLIAYHAARAALFIAQPDGSFTAAALPPDRRPEGATALLAAGPLPPAGRTAGDPRARLLPELLAQDNAGRLAGKLGVAIADFDLDSHPEIFSGEGALEPAVNRFESGRDFARAPALWRPESLRRPRPGPAPPQALDPVLARGIATADFDGDGDIDVVIAQHHGPARLWRNDREHSRPWLRLRLVARQGTAGAAGAQVEVHTPRRVWRQTYAAPLGFMGQSEEVLTFGLGDDARVQKVVIRWPSGQVQELKPNALNQVLEIRES